MASVIGGWGWGGGQGRDNHGRMMESWVKGAAGAVWLVVELGMEASVVGKAAELGGPGICHYSTKPCLHSGGPIPQTVFALRASFLF